MFKRLLAVIGVGSASVDLELEQDRVELGGTVRGRVIFEGGSVDQEVDELSISLVINSEYKHDEETTSISKKISEVKVCDRMVISAGSPPKVLPVEFKLPYNIPISFGCTNYHFETSLEIDNAIDPTDKDYITVMPNKYVRMLFDAIALLGLRTKHRSGEYNGNYQMFEFRPTSFMYGLLDEIEIYFEANENRVNVIMQIDKKAKGIFAHVLDEMDLDERYIQLKYFYTDMQSPEHVAEELKQLIEAEYRKI